MEQEQSSIEQGKLLKLLVTVKWKKIRLSLGMII